MTLAGMLGLTAFVRPVQALTRPRTERSYRVPLSLSFNACFRQRSCKHGLARGLSQGSSRWHCRAPSSHGNIPEEGQRAEQYGQLYQQRQGVEHDHIRREGPDDGHARLQEAAMHHQQLLVQHLQQQQQIQHTSSPWRPLRIAVVAALALAAALLGPGLSRARAAGMPGGSSSSGNVYQVMESSSSMGQSAGLQQGVQGGYQDTGYTLAADEGSGSVKKKAGKGKSKSSKAALVPEVPSVVLDPSLVPEEPASPEGQEYGTLWRVDKYKEMTYTQFWNLVSERQVSEATYSRDRRSILVTTKDTAPGGKRTERVGLPYDPDLYDHLVIHGVFVKIPEPYPLQDVGHALMRTVFPVWFAWLLVKAAFRLGGSRNSIQDLFMGIQLERVDGGKTGTTFADVAGIDQVKSEIMEIVTFLRDPARFLDMGARSPAGVRSTATSYAGLVSETPPLVLMVGPPGTGKTLLAKAIAGEAGVPFFSVAGTEFQEVYSGVGASRVRDMFEKARKVAPCILFIDEFDGLGKARSYSSVGDDESVHTINQLLTEMDGFEDNTGVVVMAATNRPAALDKALIRPGRFDRIVQLPLPNVDGREAILRVHARDKTLAPGLDMARIARATAGFTGAELMNLMNVSAIVSIRQGHSMITESDMFDALERVQAERQGQGGTMQQYDEDIVPPRLRKAITIYEAAKALIAYITPNFDEIGKAMWSGLVVHKTTEQALQQSRIDMWVRMSYNSWHVSTCPGGAPTGFTYFIPSEETLESRIVTRGYMEARMVVAMAGRCAERLVLGDANVSTAGASDLGLANNIAREMVYRCGFNKRLGPVNLMSDEENYLETESTRAVSDIGTELSRIALQEVEELVLGAEAKAYYGLVVNYQALGILYNALMSKEVMTGDEVAAVLEEAGVQRFPDPYVEGFGWDPKGNMVFPGMGSNEAAPLEEQIAAAALHSSNGVPINKGPPLKFHPANPYQVRTDIPDLLADYRPVASPSNK